METNQIIMLGDSLTARANWKMLLDDNDVINLGIDGNTTSDLLKRIYTLEELKPRKLFLMIGINDMNSSIMLEKILENYKKIIKKIVKQDIELVVQLPLYTQMPSFNKKVNIFNEQLEDYCHGKGITCIDLNPVLCKDFWLQEQYTFDGLHLNTKAYEQWAKQIKPLM